MNTFEERFEQAFQIADTARQNVIAFLSNVTQEKSQIRPDGDQWSIGEIAHHLILVEKRFRNLILKIVSEDQQESFLIDEVLSKRSFKLEDAVDATKIGKGRAPDSLLPLEGLEITKITAQLVALREETRSQLANLRTANLDNSWWKHPKLGPLTLYELIRYMGYHETRHLAQMKQK